MWLRSQVRRNMTQHAPYSQSTNVDPAYRVHPNIKQVNSTRLLPSRATAYLWGAEMWNSFAKQNLDQPRLCLPTHRALAHVVELHRKGTMQGRCVPYVLAKRQPNESSCTRPNGVLGRNSPKIVINVVISYTCTRACNGLVCEKLASINKHGKTEICSQERASIIREWLERCSRCWPLLS